MLEVSYEQTSDYVYITFWKHTQFGNVAQSILTRGLYKIRELHSHKTKIQTPYFRLVFYTNIYEKKCSHLVIFSYLLLTH